MTWRDRLRPIIFAVLQEHPDADEATLRRALREARPKAVESGPYWPYRIWLDEVKRQRGLLGRMPKRKVRGVAADAR